MPKSQTNNKQVEVEPRQSQKSHSTSKPRILGTIGRILCGLIFIAAAVIVLLNIFGVITLTINIGIFIAITALAIIAIYSAFHLFWAGFFFLGATIITIMNANHLVFSLEGFAIGNLFIAAALLTVAFHIFFRQSVFSISIGDSTDANFGSTVKYFEGELDHASLESNFGNIKAYFSEAEPKNGEAHLDIECNFSSIELYIPENWRVINNTKSSFGGTAEKNHATLTEKSPTLTISGEINFGGITIIYN